MATDAVTRATKRIQFLRLRIAELDRIFADRYGTSADDDAYTLPNNSPPKS